MHTGYFLALVGMNLVIGALVWRLLGAAAGSLAGDAPAARWARGLRWLVLAWFVAAIGLAASPLFQQPWLAPNVRVALPVGVAVPLLASLALWGVAPHRRVIAALPLATLLGLHAMRVPIGATIVLLSQQGLLPASAGWEVGLGDVLVGLLALPLALAARRGLPSRWLLLAWNVIGLLDLLHALRLGLTVVVPFVISMQLPALLAPVALFGVPILLLSHMVIVRALWRKDGRPLVHRSAA
ncbi:MAG: hypothetical protein MUD01_03685 [Chloroflexaceae bacterium]|jgi:hypothetical protein|nr:hypothetical protein [Chloroflexaceae bacterium]